MSIEPPEIRYVPHAELIIYQISEDELKGLEQGHAQSLFMTLGPLLIGIAITGLTTLLTVTMPSTSVRDGFLIATSATGIPGALLMGLGIYRHFTSANIGKTIRSRANETPAGTKVKTLDGGTF
ncbi:MAG: hypothetical protein HYV27_20880 [Candidatus Hydrogenedentes bacterium]|nr:hypothetical protein [Candidatus Hydrogenedentota bacterium]